MKIKPLEEGNYIFHLSALQEASEEWVQRRTMTPTGQLFFGVLLKSKKDKNTKIMSIDRTITKLSNSPHSVGYQPGILSSLQPVGSQIFNDLNDDEYFLKMCSLQNTDPSPSFIVVSDDKYGSVVNLAKTKQYLLNIKKVSDFFEGA
ncbi:MAG: hypothetical protein HZB67_00505 [Candidatus Aenigmarchaeota archaeon]|nr:hypothetical protein [Candidatus Aenigmarchaeota archaeon]MBI5398708.1 hypothetical protein [Candidatus Woesearchaeota archaeon]